MSARNLAIVISPNLYRCNMTASTDPLLAMAQAQSISEFTQRLVEARKAMLPLHEKLLLSNADANEMQLNRSSGGA